MKSISTCICTHIVTDKQWFQENMLCLLSNAVKYSNHGTITIKISKVNPSILNADGRSSEFGKRINSTLLLENTAENQLNMRNNHKNHFVESKLQILKRMKKSLP